MFRVTLPGTGDVFRASDRQSDGQQRLMAVRPEERAGLALPLLRHVSDVEQASTQISTVHNRKCHTEPGAVMSKLRYS